MIVRFSPTDFRMLPYNSTASLRWPPGGRGRVARLCREIQGKATGGLRVNHIEHISHCPQCRYRLRVPSVLSRPGNCPECGWGFDEQTVVLFGNGGQSFHAARPPAQRKSAFIRDRTMLIAAGVLVMGVPLAALFLPALSVRLLPSGLQGLAPVVMALPLVGIIALAFWIKQRRRVTPGDHAQSLRLAAAPVGPDLLWLTETGFWQSPTRVLGFQMPGEAQPALIPYADLQFRVRFDGFNAHVLFEPPARTAISRKWRLWLSHASEIQGLRLRPVDFLLPADRDLVRQLRRRLRQWNIAEAR